MESFWENYYYNSAILPDFFIFGVVPTQAQMLYKC